MHASGKGGWGNSSNGGSFLPVVPSDYGVVPGRVGWEERSSEDSSDYVRPRARAWKKVRGVAIRNSVRLATAGVKWVVLWVSSQSG